MRYISDDNKVFNTEQECCEHEQKMRDSKAMKERLEEERRRRICEINKKYEELQRLISEFEKDFMVRQKPYFAPVHELMNLLCI